MSCESTREELMGLEPAEFDSVLHLQSCDECRAFADEIRAMDEAMADAVDDFAGAGNFESEWAAAQVEARPRPSGRWWSMGALTTLAAAAAILLVVMQTEILPNDPPFPDPLIAEPLIAAPPEAPDAEPVAAEPEPTPEEPRQHEPVADPEPEPAPPPPAEPPPRSKPAPKPSPRPRPAADPTPPPAPAPDYRPEPAPADVAPEPPPEPSPEPSAAAPRRPAAPTMREPKPRSPLVITGGPASYLIACPSGFQTTQAGSSSTAVYGMPTERCDLLIDGTPIGKVKAGLRYKLTASGDSWKLTRN